jgi:hypothetical protein
MVLEDFVPIPNVQVKIDIPEKVKNVYQIPGKEKLEWKKEGKSIEVAVPTFTMHTGIVVEYE